MNLKKSLHNSYKSYFEVIFVFIAKKITFLPLMNTI